jgi:hypothetical protein
MATFNPQLPLPAKGISGTGAPPTFAPVSASDILVNDGMSILIVKNGGGSADIVTVAVTGQCDQFVSFVASMSVAAGTTQMLGPFSIDRFGQAPTVTHTFVTSVTAALITTKQ